MFKKTEDKYKKLHPSWSHSKIYKNSFFPIKGLAVSIFIILIMILCFIPPILAAMFKINRVKVFGTPKKVALVNVQVLNTQDEEKNYFSNFDSDTKLAVVDNSANVHIWNSLKDFVNLKLFNESEMSDKVTTIGTGAAPVGCGDIPIVMIDNDKVEHHLI